MRTVGKKDRKENGSVISPRHVGHCAPLWVQWMSCEWFGFHLSLDAHTDHTGAGRGGEVGAGTAILRTSGSVVGFHPRGSSMH